MVNGFMKRKNVINRALAAKKLYISPLTEVTKINMVSTVLTGSSEVPVPVPPHPGAPARGKATVHRTPVF